MSDSISDGVDKLRNELKAATRSVIVTIINRTNQVLFRTNFSLVSGRWRKFPEGEYILPNSFVHIASESYGFLTGTEGSVEYRVPPSINPNAQPFNISWKNPYIGTKTYSCGEGYRKDNYSIEKAVILEDMCQMVFTIHDDTLAQTPITSVITTPSIPAPGVNNGANSNAEISTLILSSEIPAPSEQWKVELARAQKCVLASITNQCGRILEKVEQNLTAGIWRKEPPKYIPIDKTIEFGSESHGIYGTEGSVVYKEVLGGSVDQRAITNCNFVKFYWSVPLVGSRRYEEPTRDGVGGFHFYVERNVKESAVYWKVTTRQIMPTNSPPIMYAEQQQQYIQQRLALEQQHQQKQPQYVDQKPTLQQQQYEYMVQQQYIQQQQQQRLQQQQQQQPQVTNQQKVTNANTTQQENVGGDVIANLNKQAEEGIPTIDNKTGLNIYYHMANQIFEQGNFAKKNGNLEIAYVMYMKYTTFILQRIPSHLSYNLPKFDDDKVTARGRCVRLLNELETMQSQIIEKRKKEMQNISMQFPTVPPDHPPKQ